MLKIEKYAAIDIGSNAIRLLIATVIVKDNNPPQFKKTSLVRVPIRLGADVFLEDKISEANYLRMLDAMNAYQLLMKTHGVVKYRACATSAMREATNGVAIAKKIKKETNINIEIIENSDQLTASLKALNHSVDVLLTLPDPIVYNKNTIRGFLLLAYRNKLPIIGFSKAYVKAGAIAAIYSKPEQISKQVLSIVDGFLSNNAFEHNNYYPDDFSIALNKNIARSLGIKLASEKSIIKQIKKAGIK